MTRHLLFCTARDAGGIFCAALLLMGAFGWHDVWASVAGVLIFAIGLAGSHLTDEWA